MFDFIKKTTSYRIEEMYLLYIFSPELHTLMTSHPRKILLVVPQVGKPKTYQHPYLFTHPHIFLCCQ
jgi:hypothetical protein